MPTSEQLTKNHLPGAFHATQVPTHNRVAQFEHQSAETSDSRCPPSGRPNDSTDYTVLNWDLGLSLLRTQLITAGRVLVITC